MKQALILGLAVWIWMGCETKKPVLVVKTFKI